MQSSKLGYQTWVIAMYLMTTSLKGVSSMKLHRDLRGDSEDGLAPGPPGSARCGGGNGIDPFDGPIEADETYIGGKVKNMHEWQRVKRGGMRGTVGKVGIVGNEGPEDEEDSGRRDQEPDRRRGLRRRTHDRQDQALHRRVRAPTGRSRTTRA